MHIKLPSDSAWLSHNQIFQFESARLRMHCLVRSMLIAAQNIYWSELFFTFLNSSQVILSSLEHGVREGRILLHEWLVNLVAQYNDAFKIAEYTRGSLTTPHIDVAFTQCPQLQPLPRLVFALLRNPLLRFHEEGVHPDYRIYLQCLFRYIHCYFLLDLCILHVKRKIWKEWWFGRS